MYLPLKQPKTKKQAKKKKTDLPLYLNKIPFLSGIWKFNIDH